MIGLQSQSLKKKKQKKKVFGQKAYRLFSFVFSSPQSGKQFRKLNY